MRIKLDENLPDRLVPLLTQLGRDVDTVVSELLAGQDDDVVWRAAQRDGRFLITQDLEFSDARKFVPAVKQSQRRPTRTSGDDRFVDAGGTPVVFLCAIA